MKSTTRNNESKERPRLVKPMLCTLVKQPFADDDYVFEVKWDGYRIIAHCDNGDVWLQSRGGEDYSRKYPSIVTALTKLDFSGIIDGEVVYLNQQGKPDFDALQRVNGQKGPLVFYAFDLLWQDDRSVMNNTLLERKQALKDILEDNSVIRFSDHFDDGLVLFDHVKNVGLEGIIAKRKDSPYIPGDRSKRWLKVTVDQRQEFVIGGWVESEKRGTFRTLLFGTYENGKLKWKGHAGGGYKERDMPVILDKLRALETDENPFDTDVEYSEGKPHWVKPELVANIKFATTTRSGKIRKPAIFLGFREDKRALDVEPEIAREAPKARLLTPRKSAIQSAARVVSSNLSIAGSHWPEIEAVPVRNQEVLQIDDCIVEVSNVDRELWKGISKAHLIDYYFRISRFILPHLKDRPLSLHLKPKGPNAPGLYIKDMEDRQPQCAEIFTVPRKHKKPDKRDIIDYLVCNNAPTLLYIVNLGCIDLNPWTARRQTPLYPDFIVIDLDPSDGDFKKAVTTAIAAREFLQEHRVKSFVKTSGKTGLHIFIPCSAFDFAQARRIAESICLSVHSLVPNITTTEITVADRGDKLYLDPNQNDYADTMAAAYSVRPFKHPTVSTPLDWKEVNASLSPDNFTIKGVAQRLEKKGDLFLPTLDRAIAKRNDKPLSNFT
ncbi:MAG TPA: DNA ligase D [Chryseosolibacter sp.]